MVGRYSIRVCLQTAVWVFFLSILVVFATARGFASHYGKLDQSLVVHYDEPIVFGAFFNNSAEKFKKVYLDHLANALSKDPALIGYVISYGGKTDLNCESVSNLKWIRKYLVGTKKIKSEQVIYIDGGYVSKGITDLFVISKGDRPPTPAPNFYLNDLLGEN